MEVRETTVKMLSAKDLAQAIGSRNLAYRLLNIASFPTVRIGKRLLVREDSFDKWMKENEGKCVDIMPDGN